MVPDSVSAEVPVLRGPFHPTWPRALLAAAVAIIAFCLPQEIPLEWYPLNNPSSGLQYLEITCAGKSKWLAEISLDTGRGFNALDKIEWPMGPSEMAFTYTFPLADAPLFSLQLDPTLSDAAQTKITNFRIINRRGEEIGHFIRDPEKIPPSKQATAPGKQGWRLIDSADNPRAFYYFIRPLVAEGMNERNLKRCLLSIGYLTVMLWILLLAVYFAFRRGGGRRALLESAAFLLLLSFCFSFVGNRGLMKNSIHYAWIAASGPAPAAEMVVLRKGAPIRGVLGAGWYDREGTSRWTAKRATVAFQSGPAGKVLIKGQLQKVLSPNQIKIWSNGSLVHTQEIHAGRYTIECLVEKNTLIQLRIEVGTTIVPKEKGLNDDPRELGILVSDISSQ